MTRKKQKPEEIAEKHWEYTRDVMKQAGTDDALLERFHFVYTAAFMHGFKHAMEKKK